MIEEMNQLREQGLTYQTIGDKFGLSRQRIHQILSGYHQRPEVKERVKAYKKTDKYKEYRKTYYQRTKP